MLSICYSLTSTIGPNNHINGISCHFLFLLYHGRGCTDLFVIYGERLLASSFAFEMKDSAHVVSSDSLFLYFLLSSQPGLLLGSRMKKKKKTMSSKQFFLPCIRKKGTISTKLIPSCQVTYESRQIGGQPDPLPV